MPAPNLFATEKQVKYEEEKVSKPSSDLPDIGGGGSAFPSLGGGGFSLGGVGSRGGKFEADPAAKARAMAELAKMNKGFDDAFPGEEDNRSMMEIMREKNKKAEAELAAAKAQSETMEERKARLLAQRDHLRKMKEEKRQ